MPDDAGMREVFRGELSIVELAAGVLDEQNIEYQRQWEQAGGTVFTIGDTALVPGRVAILLVPSVAFDEAREALASFDMPEPEYLTDFSEEVRASRDKRRLFGRVVASALLAPLAIWFMFLIVALVKTLLE